MGTVCGIDRGTLGDHRGWFGDGFGLSWDGFGEPFGDGWEIYCSNIEGATGEALARSEALEREESPLKSIGVKKHLSKTPLKNIRGHIDVVSHL